MDGIINVYKEQGFTSHDVVAKLRGILHFKKIGHTGTLDPDAVGVLPVCVGKATKVCDLLTNQDKTYTATVKLGVTTDTYDMSGKILSECEPEVSEEELGSVLQEFIGDIEQIPPMYSAIKVNGKKLYELARQGKEIERKPRIVTIQKIRLLEFEDNTSEFVIEVTCSKGTYIRSLCHDIGEKLGCGASMKFLIRNRVGSFCEDDALTLPQIEESVREQKWDMLLPIDSIFTDYPACRVAGKAMKFLQNGGLVSPKYCSLPQGTVLKNGDFLRMYSDGGEFYAIYRYDENESMFRIVKMFH